MPGGDLDIAQVDPPPDRVPGPNLDSHAPLRCSAVADENWVPSAAGGVPAVGGLGFFPVWGSQKRAGRCILGGACRPS